MEDIAQLNHKLESLYLRTIITGLRDGSITVEESRLFSKAFLQKEPFQSLEEAKQKIYAYVSENPKFEKLKAYIDAYHEEQQVDSKIEQMRAHIKNNNIEEALNVAKA